MAITITEKEHWKRRIEAKIDKKIEKLKLSNPELFQSVTKQAHTSALQSLGLTKLHQQCEQTKTSIKKSREKEEQQLSEMHKILKGEPETSWRAEDVIKNEVKKQQSLHEEELLLNHELGRKISILNEEKENLLDTVWLATSPRQITDLWEQVSLILGEESTAFQKEVLANKPKEDNSR